METKNRAYPEEIRQAAIKSYYSGVSGCGVGKIFSMSKANVYNWIKKTWKGVSNGVSVEVYELDELYWYIGRKPRTETRENAYIITMVSREPRQIVGIDTAWDKSPEGVQRIVDASTAAKYYCTDGWSGDIDVVYYPGGHIRNCWDKGDTFTVEGVNADLRHYIPVLARRSRCFCRKIETLQAVLAVFVETYNAFGAAKLKCRVPVEHTPSDRKKHQHKFRELAFSLLDFL
jgi:transposase-like protein